MPNRKNKHKKKVFIKQYLAKVLGVNPKTVYNLFGKEHYSPLAVRSYLERKLSSIAENPKNTRQ